jgi:CDP-glycerol glycerophosphotransferase (TagB/SpsB family)
VHQRIGWDPASEQIRSWLFRSDGGFEEGAWARSDNVWIVKRVGVLPDGARTSTVNLWHHEPPAKCWFKAFQERAGKGDDELSAAVMLLQRVDAP